MKISRYESERIANRMRCGDCLGHLVVNFTDDPMMNEVTCTTEGCSCSRFISHYKAERIEHERRLHESEKV